MYVRPVVHLYMTDTSPILHPQLIATHRPMQFSQVSIDMLVDYRLTIGQLSFDYGSTVGWLSTDSRPIVDRYIYWLTVGRYMAWGHLSTHDPILLLALYIFILSHWCHCHTFPFILYQLQCNGILILLHVLSLPFM